MRKHLLFAAACVTLSGIALAGCSITGNQVDLDSARTFQAYPIYWVGEHFERWDLTSVDVESSAFATLIYGTCQASSDEGCSPPLQIQVSALCDHLDAITRNPIWRHRRIRGAPVAANLDGAPVLLTRRSQVKVYRGVGSDPGVELRALHALRSLSALAPRFGPRGRIPGPAPGVLEGTRPCAG